MTRPCLLTLLAVLPYTITAQDFSKAPHIVTTKDFHVTGKVKSIYEITYTAALQKRVLLDSTVYMDTVLTRNKETNTSFNEDGYLLSNKMDSFNTDAQTIFSREEAFHYDKDKLTSVLHYVDGKLTDSAHVEYNRNGKIDEQAFYDHKDKLTKKIQYFYRSGRVFNIKVRNEDGSLQNFIRFKYDLAGNLKEQEINGNTMQYLHSFRYQYDTLENGNRQVNKYDYAGKYKYKSMVRYLEDPNGNITEWIATDSNKRVTENKTMTYNSRGLLESALIFTMYKFDYTYNYQYGKHGNWKTRFEYESGKPVSKVHRVIEYYEEKSPEQ